MADWGGMPRLRTGLVSAILGLVILLAVGAPSAALGSYTVRPGDTLSHIALRTQSSVAELARLNGLTNPNRIRVGQVLVTPGDIEPSGGSSSPDSGQQYRIRAGDTLSQIAERFGVSTRVLMDTNAITNPNRIRSGQTLLIPRRGEGSPSGISSYGNLPRALRNDPERLALIGTFERWASANGIPGDLVMAVAWHESGWQRNAVSWKGAVGIGQIMPATSEWIARDLIGHPGLDPRDSEDNIRMTARYLDWLLDYFGSEDKAIAAYYQGQGSISRGVLYDDTIAYVEDVKAIRSSFQSS